MRSPTPSFARSLMCTAVVACAALGLTACDKGEAKKTTSQVAVKINGEELSVHQVERSLGARVAQAPAEQASAVARRTLESLVDQELTAQAARRDKLDQDPSVVQAMEAAKREVLAGFYLERLAEKVTEPSSDEIDRYQAAHPNLFEARRLYSLQETTVAFPPGRAEEYKQRLEATTSVDKVVEIVRADSLRSAVRQLSISAEDVPMNLLDRLAALKDGQSLVMVTGDAGRVLTLLNSTPAPVNPQTAKRLVGAMMMAERRRNAAKDGVSALRKQATVEYQGRYAELMAESPNAPSATPATAAAPAPAAAPASAP